MTSKETVLVIEKPYLTVKLHERLLEVDFAEGMRKELEDVLEVRPALRETIGFLFQTAIPLDVEIKDIESATVDKKGQVKVAIPFRKDLVIPLKPEESKRLVEKLKELIPKEKARAIKEQQESERVKGAAEPRRAQAQTEAYRRTVPR